MKTIALSILNMPENQLSSFTDVLRRVEEAWNECKSIDKSKVQLAWHFDIMDGRYVDNISMCPQLLQACMRTIMLPYDLHFMTYTLRPYKSVMELNQNKVDNVFVHLGTESAREIPVQCLTFNPDERLHPQLIAMCSKVLLMSVYPGKGGQKYISCNSKIEDLIEYNRRNQRNIEISVDGGVNLDTIEDCKQADKVIIGSTAMNHLYYGTQSLMDFLAKFADLYVD
jgi:ribulose-phosphate 3-epimerase